MRALVVAGLRMGAVGVTAFVFEKRSRPKLRCPERVK
jgi:hypothetical protein